MWETLLPTKDSNTDQKDSSSTSGKDSSSATKPSTGTTTDANSGTTGKDSSHSDTTCGQETLLINPMMAAMAEK